MLIYFTTYKGSLDTSLKQSDYLNFVRYTFQFKEYCVIIYQRSLSIPEFMK